MSEEIEAWKIGEITCPYCKYEHTDSWECGLNNDGDCMESECDECGKKFNVTLIVETSFTSRGLCKENKNKHDWKYFDFISKEDGRRIFGRECLTCGKFESDVEKNAKDKKGKKK